MVRFVWVRHYILRWSALGYSSTKYCTSGPRYLNIGDFYRNPLNSTGVNLNIGEDMVVWESRKIYSSLTAHGSTHFFMD